MCAWGSDLTSLRLSLLICKVGLIRVPTSQGGSQNGPRQSSVPGPAQSAHSEVVPSSIQMGAHLLSIYQRGGHTHGWEGLRHRRKCSVTQSICQDSTRETGPVGDLLGDLSLLQGIGHVIVGTAWAGLNSTEQAIGKSRLELSGRS